MIANGVVATPSNDNGLIIANGVPQTRHNGLVIVNGLSDRINSYIGSPTARLSTVDGNAFAWISEKNLGLYLGHKVVFTDTGGKEATGYIKEPDAVEALGSELVTNGDMELGNNWVNRGTPTTNERSSTQAHGGTWSRRIVSDAVYEGAQSDAFVVTAGKLYKIVGWSYKISAGEFPVVGNVNARLPVLFGINGAAASWQTGNQYVVATATGNEKLRLVTWLIAVSEIFFDDISVKEVTDVNATGVHIVSVKDGSTRNWVSIDSGFNPNDIDFVYIYDK